MPGARVNQLQAIEVLREMHSSQADRESLARAAQSIAAT